MPTYLKLSIFTKKSAPL